MAKATKFDAADYLRTPEQIAAYLAEAFNTGDSVFICTALETVARAKFMTNPAKGDRTCS